MPPLNARYRHPQDKTLRAENLQLKAELSQLRTLIDQMGPVSVKQQGATRVTFSE